MPQESLSAPTFGSLSLGLVVRRITGSVVGRPLEIATVERELTAAQTGMSCLSLEGEPGIGKTRLLLAIAELARSKCWQPAKVGHFETREIRDRERAW